MCVEECLVIVITFVTAVFTRYETVARATRAVTVQMRLWVYFM